MAIKNTKISKSNKGSWEICDRCGVKYHSAPFYHQATLQAFCSVDCLLIEMEAEGYLGEEKLSINEWRQENGHEYEFSYGF